MADDGNASNCHSSGGTCMSSFTSRGFHDPSAFSIVTFWLQQSTGVRPSLSLRRKRHASTGTRDDVTCAVTCSRGRRRAASAVPRSPRGPENESFNSHRRRLSRSVISDLHLLHCVEQRRALVVVLRVHCGTVMHERFAHRHMPAGRKRGFMHRTHGTRLIPPPTVK